MSKAIVSVLKQERRALLSQLKPIDAALAKFGGTAKRRRKSTGRKAPAKAEAAAPAKTKAAGAAAETAAAKKARIKRELEKD